MIPLSAFEREESSSQRSETRLTTHSLSDDDVRVIADALYRDDNPLRCETVRQAALMFEHAGYAIIRGPVATSIPALLPTPERVVVGRLMLDRRQRSIMYDRREIALKTREFDLLDALARHPGWVFTRVQLLDLVWPHAFDVNERTVDVHVTRIRQKIREPGLILAVHGVGYKLVIPRIVSSSL
jgi:DNA-binding response OmpR family regulator